MKPMVFFSRFILLCSGLGGWGCIVDQPLRAVNRNKGLPLKVRVKVDKMQLSMTKKKIKMCPEERAILAAYGVD